MLSLRSCQNGYRVVARSATGTQPRVSHALLRTFARRNARVVAYNEGDRREDKTERQGGKLPEFGVRREDRETKGQDIADHVSSKPPRSLQDVVEELKQVDPKYDSAVHVPLWQPAFTRRREVFVGRIAMLGFLGTMLGEVYTGGLGPVGQLSYVTGLSEQTVTALLLAIMAYNLLGGLNPWSPTYSRENIQDVSKRPLGPPLVSVNPLTNPKRFFGVSEWGFTKANELFQGRLAMLGFLACIYMEKITGTGPIGQVAYYLGVPVNYSAVGMGLAVWAGLATGLAYLLGNFGQVRGGEDIY